MGSNQEPQAPNERPAPEGENTHGAEPGRKGRNPFMPIGAVAVAVLILIGVAVYLVSRGNATATSDVDRVRNASTATAVASIGNVLSNARSVDADVVIGNEEIVVKSVYTGDQSISTYGANVAYNPAPNGESAYTITLKSSTGCVFALTEKENTPAAKGDHCEMPGNNAEKTRL